jgi:hypothetical protein
VDFRRDILPKLQRLTVRAVAEAMGASISHGSKSAAASSYPISGIGGRCRSSKLGSKLRPDEGHRFGEGGAVARGGELY